MFGRNVPDDNQVTQYDGTPMADDNIPMSTAPPIAVDATMTPEPAAELTLPAPQQDDATKTDDDNSHPQTTHEETSEMAEPEIETLHHPETETVMNETTHNDDMPMRLTATPEAVPDIPAFTPPISNDSETSTNDDLNALKQEALRALSPLIAQLDQSPEEKYATTLMVYKGTNDQTLLPAIYEAAKNLTDDNAKAAAIYDVVQKINNL
jgi:hypothetical protein